MATGWFFVGRSLLVIGKPVRALLGRGEQGDFLSPGQLMLFFAKLRAMERCKIRKIAVGDGAGTNAFGLIAGMLAEVMRLGGHPLANHLHALGRCGVDDLGPEGLEFIETVVKDGHDHVVLAKTLTFGFEIIMGDVEGFEE